MKTLKTDLLYGFLLWILPFIISVLTFPLKAGEPALYHSILGIISIFFAVVLTVIYFRKIDTNLRNGILLGLFFLIESLIFDFIMFIWGPINMAWDIYIKQIGIGYFVYLFIAVGFTFLPKFHNQTESK